MHRPSHVSAASGDRLGRAQALKRLRLPQRRTVGKAEKAKIQAYGVLLCLGWDIAGESGVESHHRQSSFDLELAGKPNGEFR